MILIESLQEERSSNQRDLCVCVETYNIIDEKSAQNDAALTKFNEIISLHEIIRSIRSDDLLIFNSFNFIV